MPTALSTIQGALNRLVKSCSFIVFVLDAGRTRVGAVATMRA
jgi:hypothetical protein